MSKLDDVTLIVEGGAVGSSLFEDWENGGDAKQQIKDLILQIYDEDYPTFKKALDEL